MRGSARGRTVLRAAKATAAPVQLAGGRRLLGHSIKKCQLLDRKSKTSLKATLGISGGGVSFIVDVLYSYKAVISRISLPALNLLSLGVLEVLWPLCVPENRQPAQSLWWALAFPDERMSWKMRRKFKETRVGTWTVNVRSNKLKCLTTENTITPLQSFFFLPVKLNKFSSHFLQLTHQAGCKSRYSHWLLLHANEHLSKHKMNTIKLTFLKGVYN